MTGLLNPFRFGVPSAGGAARAYRILITEGGGASFAYSLAEVRFYTAAGLATGGTVIKSGEIAGFEATKAFNGVISDEGWAISNTGAFGTHWIGKDFGPSNADPVVAADIICRSTNSAQAPTGVKLQQSDATLTTWTDVASLTGMTWWQTDAGDNARYTLYADGYAPEDGRYWRFEPDAAGVRALREAELRLTHGGADIMPAAGDDLSYLRISGFPPANLWDNSTSTLWACNGGGHFAVDFGFGNAKALTEATFTARTDGQQIPASMTVKKSANNKTFTTVATLTPGTWTAGQTKTLSW